jgi:hypothetical protein
MSKIFGPAMRFELCSTGLDTRQIPAFFRTVLLTKAMRNWKISAKALSKQLRKLTIKMKQLIGLFSQLIGLFLQLITIFAYNINNN